MKTTKNILITGIAGFIGYHVAKNLLKLGYNVIGIDNINNYYDKNLKYQRLENLGIIKKDINLNGTNSKIYDSLIFYQESLQNYEELLRIFKKHDIDIVCNLAAQAGVRYSLKAPFEYVSSNIEGFLSILECCRNTNVNHLVYSSSSSVYGNLSEIPFSENAVTESPISLYAASKKSNELMAYSYSNLYKIKTIGLRLFTVYGPWGRPDMALFKFTKKILNDEPIDVYNNGNLYRDFTYIDDVADAIVKILKDVSKIDGLYNIFNIGNNSPVKLSEFVEIIQKKLNKTAKINYLPMQPGDVEKTWSNSNKIFKKYGFKSKTSISEGVDKFLKWYIKNYKEKI